MKDWTEKYADAIKEFTKGFYKSVEETEKELIFSRELNIQCVPHGKISSDVMFIKIDKKYRSVKKELVEVKTGHIYRMPFDFDDIRQLYNFFESIGGE